MNIIPVLKKIVLILSLIPVLLITTSAISDPSLVARIERGGERFGSERRMEPMHDQRRMMDNRYAHPAARSAEEQRAFERGAATGAAVQGANQNYAAPAVQYYPVQYQPTQQESSGQYQPSGQQYPQGQYVPGN